MFTAIEIENFKGFGKRQRIELAPITCLFGANSSGKSTVLHAIDYIDRMFSHHSRSGYEAEIRSYAGDKDEFVSLVHNHDTSREISFRLDVNTVSGNSQYSPFKSVNAGNFFWDCENVSVDLAVKYDAGRPDWISRYRLFLGGDLAIELSQEPLYPGAGERSNEARLYPSNRRVGRILAEVAENEVEEKFLIEEVILSSSDMLLSGLRYGVKFSASMHRAVKQLDELLGASVELIRFECGQMLHVGPLRPVPTAAMLTQRVKKPDNWPVEPRSWQGLHGACEEDLQSVNDWLGPDGLDTGIQVERQVFSLIPASPDPSPSLKPEQFSVIRLRQLDKATGEATPALLRVEDVGCGISQVVPVVFSLIFRRGWTVLIEQPELHLHPKLQMALGDLAIMAALTYRQDNSELKGNPNCVILETHSEHLILRILRRIRETSEGDLRHDLPMIKPRDIAVYYVESIAGEANVSRLRVNEEGEFIDRWPYGFFDERLDELY